MHIYFHMKTTISCAVLPHCTTQSSRHIPKQRGVTVRSHTHTHTHTHSHTHTDTHTHTHTHTLTHTLSHTHTHTHTHTAKEKMLLELNEEALGSWFLVLGS